MKFRMINALMISTWKPTFNFTRGDLRPNEVKFRKIRIFEIYFSKNRILIKLTLHEAENFQWDLTIIFSKKMTFGWNKKFCVILGRISNLMREVTRGQKSRKRSICKKIWLKISRARPRSKIEKDQLKWTFQKS